MMPLQPDPLVPDMVLFEEGDIVLTTNGNVQSWFFALAARTDNTEMRAPFSHAEMVFRNSEGQMMLGGVFGAGVDAAPLGDRLKKFKRIAIFRANAPRKQRIEAAHILQTWMDDPHINEAEFDFSMNYQPGKRESFFCAGIVNEAYRVAGLQTPFGMRDWEPNHLTDHIEEILGRRLGGLLDINSIYYSGAFQLVLEWENDQVKQEKSELSEKIVRYLLKQYEQGLRLKIGKGYNLLLMLADFPNERERFARMSISLNGFRDDVFATWNRLSRRGVIDGLNCVEKSAVLDAIFEKFHGNYFYPAVTVDEHRMDTAVFSR